MAGRKNISEPPAIMVKKNKTTQESLLIKTSRGGNGQQTAVKHQINFCLTIILLTRISVLVMIYYA